MEGIVMTAQILLSLSILVGLHEMGHLLAAKFFGMRVEQFSIGFPPRLLKFKYGETEYALSAIPLGGFVKISGMIDESMDKEQMKQPPKPWEFRSKPAWQRLIVMLGGIFVNVITGIVIFISLTFIFGDQAISKDKVNDHGGIIAKELGREIGFQTGDKIIKINGKDFNDFNEVINPNTFLGTAAYYTVLRNGEKTDIAIPENFIEQFSDKSAVERFVIPMLPVSVMEMMKGGLGERLGLKEGDIFLSLGGQPVERLSDVKKIIAQYGGDSITAEVKRGDDRLKMQAAVEQDTMLSVMVGLPEGFLISRQYSFAQSVPMGVERAFGIIFTQLQAFGKIFRGDLDVRKSLSGPIGIAQAYGGNWDWQRFWRMTALLSMVLAFMNLLPIPALDGGHVMFLTYEMVSGRKPGDKFLEYAQKTGMVILLALMAFVIGNDIFKAFFN